jgi:predicted ferric reductase
MKNKIIFWAILIVLLGLVPWTVLQNINIAAVLKYPTAMFSLIQRLLGLFAFVLMFWQIMLGTYMGKLTDKLGGWVFNFHVLEGIVIFSLVLLHPLAFLFFRHFSGAGTDPVFVYLGFCLFCQTKLDFYYTLGRIAFWLLTVGVFAGLFRAATPYLRVNWLKFHIITYVVFLISGIHGFLLGTDFLSPPFFYFAIAASLLVLYTIVRKLPNLLVSYKKWLNS